jgi:hypothetical protein
MIGTIKHLATLVCVVVLLIIIVRVTHDGTVPLFDLRWPS